MKYRLGEVAPIQQGKVADSNLYWLLNLDVVESNTGEVLEYVCVDQSQIGASTVSFDKKNVLYSKLRPYLNKVVLPEKEGYATSEMLPLRPNEEVLTREYLTFFLRSPHFVKYINGKTSGAKMPRANTADLMSVEIECPSLEKQNRIVSQFIKIIEIIKKRQSELQLFDTLIKARFVEMFGEPIANPMSWEIKPLKELSSLITNGNTPKGGSENYVEAGITFLRSQNVWRNRIDLDDVAYIDEATHKSMRKSSLKHKDILITKTGRINTENSSLGRAALFLGEDGSANINGHVYLVRLTDAVIPEFVVTILTGEAYRKYIRKVCVGGIDKRQINVDQVEDFPIIMPPIEKQREFAQFREQVNKSKSAIQKALDETQLLFDSLMQQYFG